VTILIDILVVDDVLAVLESGLPAVQESDRPGCLVTLAWHLRQRDTVRAQSYAAEARHWFAQRQNLPETQAMLARLDLVDGEIDWLFARLDNAERIAHRALATFRGLQDHAGCSDAHRLLSSIMVDRGNPAQRDEELQHAFAEARHAGDELRADMADATLARWALFRDLAGAEARWGTAFRARLQESLDPRLGAWINDYLGMTAFQTSDFALAAQHDMQMVDAALTTGQIQRAIIGTANVGTAFGNLNEHQGALEWMERSLDMARRAGWPVSIANGLLQTAGVLRALGRLDTAHELLREARTILQSIGGSRTYALALQYSGDLALDRKDYAAALADFRELEQCVSTLNQLDLLAVSKRGQAHALALQGHAQEALAVGMASLELSIRQRDAYNHIESLLVLAEIHAAANLPAPAGMAAETPALHYLRQALDIASTISGFIIPGKLYDALGRAYASIGNTDQAYAMALQGIAAREKTNGLEATNRAVAMQVRHQTERARADAEHHRQLALAEAQRAEAMHQMSTTLEKLSAIGQEITVHLDPDGVFQTLDRHVHGLLDATHFAVYLRSADGASLDCVFGVENGSPLPAGLRVLADNPTSNVARCARERMEITRDRTSSDSSPNQIPGTLVIWSALYFPMAIGERVLGVMSIQSPQRFAYGERERLIFRTLCSYGAIALDNATAYRQLEAALQTISETKARLEEVSLTDTLTGLRNRRFLYQHIEGEVARILGGYAHGQRLSDAMQGDSDQLTFMMVDLDHFKSVNDTYGHAAGDAILQQFSRRLEEVFRQSDYIVRWGGEEFLVVARSINWTEAQSLAGRVRAAIADRPFELPNGGGLRKTCSIGFACFPFLPHRPAQLSWEQVTEVADQALYMAKQNGRDGWIGLSGTPATRTSGLLRRVVDNAPAMLEAGELLVTGSGLEKPVCT
jgi:diguanylate cyclase (GGDEF)-like protein